MAKDKLNKLEIVRQDEEGAEIKIKDTDNYVAIRFDSEGNIDRVHIDVVGLSEYPIFLKRGDVYT